MAIELDNLVAAEPVDFKRDRWGRPSIMQPNGKRKGYTRCSSAAKTIEDTFNLEKWARRNVAYGMAHDGSLVARVLAIGGEPSSWDKPDKDAVNAIVEAAEQVAKAHKAADIGTAVHRLTERLDRGEDVQGGPYQADLDAYREAMTAAGLVVHPMLIECRMVNDELEMAGTADRIPLWVRTNRHVVADVKTSASVDFGGLGWAAQLAAYAGAHLYDCEKEERIKTPDIDRETGLIIHLPAGQGRCTIYEIDIAAGLEAARLANQIRATRKAAKQWIRPYAVDTKAASKVAPEAQPATAEPAPPVQVLTIEPDETTASTLDMAKRRMEDDNTRLEGGPANPADVNTIRARIELGLTQPQTDWINYLRTVISPGLTERRANIYCAITKLATSDLWDDNVGNFNCIVQAVVDSVSKSKKPRKLSAAIAGLTLRQSTTLRTVVDQVIDDATLLELDPSSGALRIRAAA